MTARETYISMTRAAAARYGIDARIAVAQIQQESNFNPRALSPAGARGLAQFMPGTGPRFGLRTAADFYDPAKSLDAWGRYMRDLLKMFRGRYDLALAGYNWGENRATLREALRTGRSVLDFPIPAETKNYVRRILGASNVPASVVGPAVVPGSGPVNPGTGGGSASFAAIQAAGVPALNSVLSSGRQFLEFLAQWWQWALAGAALLVLIVSL